MNIHSILNEKFGGTYGIRDLGSLEATLHRPFASFDGKDLYPQISDQSRSNPQEYFNEFPFIDGNKRTAYV